MRRFLPASLATIHIHAAGVAICVLLTLGALALAVRPVLTERQRQQSQRVELGTLQERLSTVNENLRRLRREREALEQALRERPLALVPAQQSNQRLADLTSLAAHESVRLEELRTGPPASQARFDLVPIHLAGAGTYRDCTAFLHRLRTEFPDVAVESLDVAATDNADGAAVSLRLSLTWYTAQAVTAASEEP